MLVMVDGNGDVDVDVDGDGFSVSLVSLRKNCMKWRRVE